ncbi:MAG: DUF1700 domain-containing protein [Lachnospiraceae bacterium]|nr:DUF1700 domain-containing protein [Lachnospiraceae bacterium]
MTKNEFLAELKSGLLSCPDEEREERVNFYDEMISDLMEEGYTEEEAVARIGNPKEIAAKIVEDIPLAVLVKEKIKPKRTLKGWEILLIILGAPIWFSLAVAAISVVFSVFVVIWSLVVVVYSVDLALAVAAIGCIVGAFLTFSWPAGMLMVGTGVFCAGAAVVLFIAAIKFTQLMMSVTRSFFMFIKSLFISKEEA